MTEINLYLEKKESKLRTYSFEEKVTNIDTARNLLIKYLDPFYLCSKYKITVSNRYYNGEMISSIDVFFDRNTELNREFILKELLK